MPKNRSAHASELSPLKAPTYFIGEAAGYLSTGPELPNLVS
jgi:hypothetical protein